MKRFVALFALCAFLTLGLITQSEPAYAYNYSQAASYAENWATSRNTLNYPSFPSDCTNFVSQCIHDSYGGNKAIDTVAPYQWYCNLVNGQWQYSNSWSVASDLYTYFVNNPAASPVGNWGWISGFTIPPNYNSSLRLGDVVFYSWNGNSTINHSGMVSWTSGTDPNSKLVGTLTDQHTYDRYHSIWHLRPYNVQWQTTLIRVYRPY